MTSRNYSSVAQQTTLTAGVNDTSSTIAVSATTGFPAAPFVLCVDYATTSQELVLVTAISGLSLTVTRGFDSTTAVSHDAGATVVHTHGAIDFRDSRTHEAASSGVHGVTGSLVGTSDTQTLSNKDLSAGSNTFPASLATDAELSAHTTATAAHGATGALVGTTNVQALTNKDLSSATNTFPSSLATDAELAAHTGATAAHGATGAIVGTTNTQTLTNKTLSSPVLVSPSVTGDLPVTGRVKGGYAPVAMNVTVTVIDNSFATLDVTWPSTLAVAPAVTATVYGTSVYFASLVGTPTSTGCTVLVRHYQGTVTSAAVSVSLIAVPLS